VLRRDDQRGCVAVWRFRCKLALDLADFVDELPDHDPGLNALRRDCNFQCVVQRLAGGPAPNGRLAE
jgi:hypothetical protein